MEKDSGDRKLVTEERVEAMEAVARLRKITNVGPTGATYLMRLGLTRLEDAAGLDPYGLYQELCVMDAKQHHPCWMDVFAAVVSYANGEPDRPWWEFTPQRKALQRDGRL